MSCNEASRVQQYFDGEPGADAAVAVERHLQTCDECTALLGDLAAMRKLAREVAPYYRANAPLRGKIAAALDHAEGGRGVTRNRFAGFGRFLAGAASGAVATAVAAAIALFLFMTPNSDALVGDVTNAHLRSLVSNHLIDVASSDKHTVKPWFVGHADVSPPVADFSAQGYTLLGGRADYVDGHRAAVVVYRHGAHVINVFTWARGAEDLPAKATRNGYQLVFWKSGNLVFCAVCDGSFEQLFGLVRLIRA